MKLHAWNKVEQIKTLQVVAAVGYSYKYWWLWMHLSVILKIIGLIIDMWYCNAFVEDNSEWWFIKKENILWNSMTLWKMKILFSLG